MGPGIVILFWLIIAAIFGFFWLIALGFFYFGIRRKKRWMAWLGGVPLFGSTFLVLLVMGLIAYLSVRASMPHFLYEDTFHQPPAPDVADLKSKTWSFADSADTYIQFTASKSTFERLLPPGSRRVSYKDFQDQVYNNEIPPAWWTPPGPDDEIWLLQPDYGKGKSFASETTYMAYNEKSRSVRYFYLGID